MSEQLHLCLTIGLLFLLSMGAQAQESACPVLNQAWQSILAKHPSIQAASEKIKSREASANSLKATQLPKLDASASYQYTSEVAQFNIPIPAVAAAMPQGSHNRSELGITASYAIFTGFAQTNSIAAATLATHAQTMDFVQTKNNLALQLGLLHIALQSALEDSRVIQERLQVKMEHVKTIATLKQEGTATQAQVLSAQADVALAAADTAKSSRLVDSLAAEFSNLAGISYPREKMTLCVTQPPIQSSPKSYLADELETQAQSIEKSSEAATASQYPMLSAMAGYRYGNPGLQVLGSSWMGYALAGVQLQWNLFDGFERRSTLTRFSSDAKSMQFEAERLRKNQSTTLHQLNSERKSLHTEQEALEAGLAAARSAHDALQAAQVGGTAIADEIRDSDLRTLELESRLILLRYRSASLDLRIAWTRGQDIAFTGE